MLKRITSSLVISLFIFGLGKISFEQQSSDFAAQTIKKEAVNVGNKICPVTGEKIDEKTKVTYEYDGKIYNFCCPGCPEEFKKDPQKYIKRVEKELQAEAKEGQLMPSGELESGTRVIRVQASRYKFAPDPIVAGLGEKVRLVVSALDVAHGLSIDEFKIKLSIPAGKSESIEFVADKKGTFHAYCSVYCGPGHGQMHANFIVQ